MAANLSYALKPGRFKPSRC